MRTKQIRGNSATVTVKRSQPGGGCTKVRYVRIVRGTNYKSLDELGLHKVGSSRKGLCNFTEVFRVKPFEDNELLAQCRVPGGSKKVLTKKGTVTFWKTKPEYAGKRWVPDGTYRTECHDVRYCYYRRGDTCVEWRTRQECKKVANGTWKDCSEICVGKTIKNKKSKQRASRQIGFAARVHCKQALDSGSVHLPTACNIKNWWKFTSSDSTLNGEWFFHLASSSGPQGRIQQGNYTAKGPSPSTYYVGMSPPRGKYSGYATVKADKTFSLRVGNTTCTGRIDAKCSRIDGRCLVKPPAQRGRSYPFTLVRSNGPKRGGVKKSPVGKSQVPGGSTIPQQKAPTLPGGGFKPGPNIPSPTPHW